MYCRKCGAILKDSAKFCDSCGSEVIKVKQRSYAQKYNDNKIKQKMSKKILNEWKSIEMKKSIYWCSFICFSFSTYFSYRTMELFW